MTNQRMQRLSRMTPQQMLASCIQRTKLIIQKNDQLLTDLKYFRQTRGGGMGEEIMQIADDGVKYRAMLRSFELQLKQHQS